MILGERLIERFSFACEECAQVWETEYEVRRVEDGHGHARDYFFRHRQPITDPRAPLAVTCAFCTSPHEHARLVTRLKPVTDPSPERGES